MLSYSAGLSLGLLMSCRPSAETSCPEAVAYPQLLTEAQLLAQPQLLAGIYAAYPTEELPDLTPSPTGYEPFYISHYGRHGSRFQPNDSRYLNTLHRLQDAQTVGNLTDFGQSLLPRIERLCDYACGHGGELSTLGAKQHTAIAQRMYERFAEVFSGHACIQACSSISGRCIASMEAFATALNSCDTTLQIHCASDTAFMAFLSFDTPEERSLSKDTTQQWYRDYSQYALSHLQLGRLMDTLFINPIGIDSLHTYADLYWLVAGMQDLELDVDLSDVFTPQELLSAYRCVNYRMYVCNANCPASNGIPLASASSLLRNILDNADETLDNGSPMAAHLRFGHDSNLLRLLALMHVHNASNQQADTARYWTAWQECTLSPMAANLQMVFYRPINPDDGAPILVKLLLNEREVLLDGDIKTANGPYYRWTDLRTFCLNQLSLVSGETPTAEKADTTLTINIQ